MKEPLTITYFAADETMGDTPSAACEQYRTWAYHALKDAYPLHRIYVMNTPSLTTCTTNDEDHRDAIVDFCAYLWDRCPWDWEDV